MTSLRIFATRLVVELGRGDVNFFTRVFWFPPHWLTFPKDQRKLHAFPFLPLLFRVSSSPPPKSVRAGLSTYPYGNVITN